LVFFVIQSYHSESNVGVTFRTTTPKRSDLTQRGRSD
jgi:hypothetical protein